MRKLFFVLLPAISLTLFLGCSPSEKKADVPPPPSAPQEQAAPAPQQPAPAPPAQQQPESAKQIVQGYAQGLTNTMNKARSAQAKVDMDGVKAAVNNYQIENGRYPSSLDEVKGSLRADVDLSLYNYDPATGGVSLK